MADKKWALRSANVGILGGIFLTVSPMILFSAITGLNEQLTRIISILVMCTWATIFYVAIRAKIYYKEDKRVTKSVTNWFLLAGILGWIPIFIFFPLMFIVGVLSIVGGIGYASCIQDLEG